MKKYPYLSTISATLLSILELLLGLISLVALFRVIYFLGILIGSIIRVAQGNNTELLLDQVVNMISSLSGSALGTPEEISAAIQPYMTSIGFGMIQAIVSSVVIFIITLLYPLLSILNGYGAISLRFRKKGSGLIKGVHIIYAVIQFLGILSTIFGVVYLLWLNKSLMKTITGSTSGTEDLSFVLSAVVIAFAGISLIVQLLVFCYHKDIAMNMGYISSELNNKGKAFSKNHLSGLAILFGLFYIVLIAISVLSSIKLSAAIPYAAIIVLGIAALKYFLVASANRSLKLSVRTAVAAANRPQPQRYAPVQGTPNNAPVFTPMQGAPNNAPVFTPMTEAPDTAVPAQDAPTFVPTQEAPTFVPTQETLVREAPVRRRRERNQ